MIVNEEECEVAGLDVKKVESLARRISKAAREAEELGLYVFGGSGSGDLRFRDERAATQGPLIVALLDGQYDGGDGGGSHDDSGLLRGEA